MGEFCETVLNIWFKIKSYAGLTPFLPQSVVIDFVAQVMWPFSQKLQKACIRTDTVQWRRAASKVALGSMASQESVEPHSSSGPRWDYIAQTYIQLSWALLQTETSQSWECCCVTTKVLYGQSRIGSAWQMTPACSSLISKRWWQYLETWPSRVVVLQAVSMFHNRKSYHYGFF